MRTLQRGILISLEGIDGSGKSTLAANLADRLQTHTIPVLLTKEPGSTALGKKLRTILQEQTVPVISKAEFLLFAADRAQHFQEFIIPTLADNKLIISDRMADSSIVYQGYGRNLDIATLKLVNQWAMAGYAPDVTIYVKIEPEIALERIRKRNEALTAFEKTSQEFTKKLVTGFEELFATRNNIITVDGAQEPEVVANQATQAVMQWLTENDIFLINRDNSSPFVPSDSDQREELYRGIVKVKLTANKNINN